MATLLSNNQEEQLSALRRLKNVIVGHTQKKEKWIEAGVLEPIVRILESSKSAAKSSQRDNNGSLYLSSASLSIDEALRLQALQILASFTSGMNLLSIVFLLQCMLLTI